MNRNPLILLLAGPMGLEPTPSGVTGRRYNQLNYDPAIFFKIFFISLTGQIAQVLSW